MNCDADAVMLCYVLLCRCDADDWNCNFPFHKTPRRCTSTTVSRQCRGRWSKLSCHHTTHSCVVSSLHLMVWTGRHWARYVALRCVCWPSYWKLVVYGIVLNWNIHRSFLLESCPCPVSLRKGLDPTRGRWTNFGFLRNTYVLHFIWQFVLGQIQIGVVSCRFVLLN